MNDRKIIQIINVKQDMRAEYDNGDDSTFESPIVCLALVEDDEGFRYVEPMAMTTGDCDIDFSGSHESNFMGMNIYD